MLRQGVHIESIRRNVMSCGGEAHYPEYCQCQLEEEGSGDGKCNACQCKGKDVLHDDGPPPFSLDQVDKWTPERLDYPWQVEPTGVESDIRVGYSQTLVHDDGNGHHGYVGQTLCKVQGRYPCPRTGFLGRLFHGIFLFLFTHIASRYLRLCNSAAVSRHTYSLVRP